MQERMDRAKRRQLIKEDQAWVGKPFELRDNVRAVQANTRHLALMLLDTQVKRRASRAAAFSAQLIDVTLAKKVEGPVACAKGCHYCCTTFVSATIPEILRLAQAVRGQAETAERVAAAASESQRIPQHEREQTRLHCAILADKACTAYAARPTTCRFMLSKSLDGCLRIFAQNSGEMPPYADNAVDVRAHTMLMMQAALILSGLPHRHYELNQAVAVALSQDGAEDRWLKGEPLFEDVTVDSGDLEASPLTNIIEWLVNTVRPTL